MAVLTEQAGIEGATSMMPESGIIRPETIVVRQTQRFEDKTFVMVSFKRLIEARQESCTIVYQVHWSAFGAWSPGSGGCSGHWIADGKQERKTSMEISGGRGSESGLGGQGHSYVYGLMYQDDIAFARAVWEDGQVLEAPVINGSYLILRSGQVGFERVEGLDINKQTVFGSDLWVNPAKEQ